MVFSFLPPQTLAVTILAPAVSHLFVKSKSNGSGGILSEHALAWGSLAGLQHRGRYICAEQCSPAILVLHQLHTASFGSLRVG